jgi:hypothetical protein
MTKFRIALCYCAVLQGGFSLTWHPSQMTGFFASAGRSVKVMAVYAQTIEEIDRKITEIRRAQAEAEDPLAICLLGIAIESLESERASLFQTNVELRCIT